MTFLGSPQRDHTGYRILQSMGDPRTQLLCIHGKWDYQKEAIDRGVDIVLYGHTHRPVIDIDDDIIAVNPGSLSYPRQEGRQPSYAIMEIDRRGKVHFTIAYLRQ